MLHSCPFPYYCPANSSSMKSCEGGSMPANTSGLRGSKNSCCIVCEGGTYRPSLASILQCLPCPPGYFCPPGTLYRFWQEFFIILNDLNCTVFLISYTFNATGADNYKKNPCPLGYVCPLGSTQPISCPPGSFGNLTRAEKMDDCRLCLENTFNHLPAQKACFPCGSSSTSQAG